MQVQAPLSNLQKELLKLYTSNVSETDLLTIKRFLVKFFAEKAITEADKIWDEKGYSNETMKNWLNEDNVDYGK